ncbi:hypothetical protein CRG98_019931 [Punica granatum]|uniref:Uncharacterized protein n=1 Tax=Punica granatum TaxID=22663 RepID=A0A2I0JTM3_PUNGR|nr:hypothetical protein CRG98_019931 [Punica granatum]
MELITGGSIMAVPTTIIAEGSSSRKIALLDHPKVFLRSWSLQLSYAILHPGVVVFAIELVGDELSAGTIRRSKDVGQSKEVMKDGQQGLLADGSSAMLASDEMRKGWPQHHRSDIVSRIRIGAEKIILFIHQSVICRWERNDVSPPHAMLIEGYGTMQISQFNLKLSY